MAELGVGYISVVPTVKDVTPGIKKALGGAEPAAAQAGGAAGEKYNGAFGKVAGKLGGAMKKTALGAGVAAGGAITAGITKGIGRLNSIEQAEAKLTGLGNSGRQVGSIMEDALASVKGTSFGLEEAATTAAGMVAAGIKPGKELEGVLTTVGDTATIAGRSMADMGQIFGSVAAKGKLQGDDMLQLLAGGIPVLQLLGDELGKTSEEISEMVSKGEIDFATFESAMRNGMGGAAQEAGQTAEGAFKNMWAAAGRLGANLAGPFFNQAAGAFSGVTDALDNMDAKVKPAMAQFETWLTGTGIPAAKNFASETVAAFRSVGENRSFQNAVDGTAAAVKSLWDAGKSLAPVVLDIGKSLGQASAALGVGAWQMFVGVLGAAGSVAQALAGPLEIVSGFMQDHPGLVTAAVGAWAAFKTVPGLVSKVTDVISPLTSRLSSAKDVFAEAAEQARTFGAAHPEVSKLGVATSVLANNVPMVARMGEAYRSSSAGLQAYAAEQRTAASAAKVLALSQTDVFTSADALGRQMGSTLKANIASTAAVAKGVGAAGFTAFNTAIGGVKTAAGGLIGALGGPVGAAIMGATLLFANQKAGAQALESAHERVTEAVHEGAAAQKELQAELAGTTGEMGEQGLAAATKIAKAELSEFIEMGGRDLPLTERFNQAVSSADKLLAKIPGLSNAQMDANIQAAEDNKKLQDSYKQLESTMDNLGIPMENLNSIVASGGPEFDKLVAKLRESGDAGNAAADQLEEARGTVQDLADSARNVAPAFAEAAEGVETLADAGASATDKLGALEQVMQALGLAPKDAEAAMMDAADAVDKVVESVAAAVDETAALGDGMFDMSGKLDPANANARELSSVMGDLRSELQNVAVNGGDTQAAFENMSPALQEIQSQFQLTDDQMKNLIESQGLVPDKIDMLVDLEGADEATQQLVGVTAALNGVPPGKAVNVGVLDEDAKRKLESFNVEVETLRDGSSELKVEDQQALDRVNWWMTEGFPQIDLADPTAKANLDDSGLLYKTEYAKMQLETLDLERPFPWADMDIGSLSQKQLAALQQVGLLDGQTPTPDAFMDISQMSAKQQEALAKVFNLDEQKPTPAADMDKSKFDNKKGEADGQLNALNSRRATPTADLNNDGVRDGVNESNSWLSSLRDKVVNVIFQATYTGFKDGFEGGGGSSRFATGGQYPGFASGTRHAGYRLPKSGPGTEKVDGFTAYDKDMIPAARLDAGEWIVNRRSSEKYNRELAEINAGTFPKLKGYADGGRYRHADEIDKFSRGLEGKPYVWGGVNWGDCSGAMSAIARYAVGMSPFAGRFATGNMREALAAMGFKPGRGGPGDLRFGWYNGGPWGGHTSGTLPNGVNVEMGGGRGDGQYGGPAAGADAPDNTDHAHLTVPGGWEVAGIEGAEFLSAPEDRTYGASGDPYDDTPIAASTRSRSGAGSTGSATSTGSDNRPTSWSDVAATAASAAAKGFVSDALGVFGIPDTPPALAAQKEYYEAKAAFEEEQRNAEEDSSRSRTGSDTSTPARTPSDAGQTRSHQTPPNLDMPSTINRTVEIAYDPAGGAQQWKTTVEMALKRTSLALSNVGRTIEQIDIESGGDPNAKNDWDVNAQRGDPSIGLLQVIKSTFEANRDKELPNDQRHPLANIVAALNYTKGQYGGPEKIWPTRAGYRDGGLVLGPGGGRSDSIDARLSNREFVTNASATAKNLGLLQAINGGAAVQPAVEAAVSLMDMLDRSSSWTPGVPRVPESTLRRTSSSADRGGDHIENHFISANPQEMQRLYRRESSRGKRGRVGARR
ncbi:tape measure protein [Corynebacterium glyciniphilum]|uniref:tape measure protein n=1 Tax=Corynebacterium glyciniphilum TaxID=1404244 RepID=UPI003FD551CE